ncbi:MAG: hydrogenase maturation protein HypF [Gammaproteobacteria bacterium]|nr:MAG: hydrogenase maturation protein HypF [Gammaproteobacteria bacterium]TND02137.1 MAG: hydrogenase maturation protein HypF [Gammaproteobacteria bacterium]
MQRALDLGKNEFPRSGTVAAVRLIIGGRVQGVGFRPFVYRTAVRCGISGHVCNHHGSVEILAQGDADRLDGFIDELLNNAPPLAIPRLILREAALPVASEIFRIKRSADKRGHDVYIPPDYFVCDDCLGELHDPADRRFRHPFINCTQCGPRYTLIDSLPYDRPNTSMRPFELCADCAAEYRDPLDRRFHAEPIACTRCGPRLWFLEGGFTTGGDEAALAAAITALRRGAIVAVKGVGGYHLLCDATNAAAVARLRQRKQRPDKPLAVMFPMRGADGLDGVRHAAIFDDVQATHTLRPARPVVLMKQKERGPLADNIAPGLHEIGVMLPYSPLHHLLLNDFGGPLVATSANISGEPVLTVNVDAQTRLAGIADAFLHHDREIVRPADDPVYRVINAKVRPLRLGRGNAPLELLLATPIRQAVLAVGGHMKNTVALAWDNRVVISPHIGDLGSLRSQQVFEQTINDLQRLYDIDASRIVCDAHPGYASTRWAKRSGKPCIEVFHHQAHASAVAGEFCNEPRWLVFTWDGTGYGEDGTLWGGEALLGRPGTWRRVASMRRFELPGGDKAGIEPWRTAASLCRETGLHWPDAPENSAALNAAFAQGFNSPLSSAVGRLFDASAALTGLVLCNSHDAHAPMRLEAAATGVEAAPIHLADTMDDDGIMRTDWSALVPMLLDPHRVSGERAACFHATLAQTILRQARAIRDRHGDFAVGFAGGVFQNRILTEQAMHLLDRHDFRTYFPERIPVNDGGLCFGQVIEAQAMLNLP